MSKARLVITAVIVEGRTQAEVAATYGVSKGWVSKLIARYNAEGETAFEPRSRRPKTSPQALDPATAELILELRGKLATAGLDAGPDTIAWHLEHHHDVLVSRSTISRHLARAGLVVPEAEEATQVLLPPVRSRDAQPDLAVRLHPLPTFHRLRRGDHQLARRLHPLRTARLRAPPDHRTDRASPRSAKPLPHTGSRPPP